MGSNIVFALTCLVNFEFALFLFFVVFWRNIIKQMSHWLVRLFTACYFEAYGCYESSSKISLKFYETSLKFFCVFPNFDVFLLSCHIITIVIILKTRQECWMKRQLIIFWFFLKNYHFSLWNRFLRKFGCFVWLLTVFVHSIAVSHFGWLFSMGS